MKVDNACKNFTQSWPLRSAQYILADILFIIPDIPVSLISYAYPISPVHTYPKSLQGSPLLYNPGREVKTHQEASLRVSDGDGSHQL